MGKPLNAVFCAEAQNDLVSALRQSGCSPALADSPDAAIAAAPEGGAVFLLADGYPASGTLLTEEALATARAKSLKLYVEYPERILGRATQEPETIRFERLIAPDGFFGAMEKGSILMLNGCWYRRFTEKRPGLLCLGTVAGFDRLAFGMPEETVTILDWLDERRDVLIAASCLSSFITGRYAPTGRWRALWEALLQQMGAGTVALQWKGTVSVEAGEHEPLPTDAVRRAWRRNVEWASAHMIEKRGRGASVFEGLNSAIDCTGRQYIRGQFRGDCMGETAMELCYGWKQTGNPELKKTCMSILDLVLTPGLFFQDDPEKDQYGLNNWYENGPIFYTDDNARVLLGALSVRSLTEETRWDEKLLRCVLANLRTSGKNGLRQRRLEESSFLEKTWMDFYNEEVDFVQPHHQAYILAVFLWMYALTGIEELLEKSEKAISIIMSRFPDGLHWTNSLTCELARMLLPLSFLMRVRPSEQHRQWLRQAVDAVIAYQQPCGAIRDAFGDFALGTYPPPQSNESYGTTEASLIQKNGDPVTDLLYTANFAFIGLWEASLALEEEDVKQAYRKLRDFLLRIQVRSKKYPELDGVWMRSFDYSKWEYWGSAADAGWSVWCVETGWMNSWIATTLLLDERGESLMRLDAKDGFSAIAKRLYEEMLTPPAGSEKA